MEVLGFIPARANSKGVAGKNIKLLNGKPLLGYTIEEGKKSRINRLIVSTDSPEIAEISQALGAEVPFLRSPELSQDDSVIEDALIDVLGKLNEKEGYRPDVIVLLQPTSPLRTAAHVDDCIDLLEEKKSRCCCIGVRANGASCRNGVLGRHWKNALFVGFISSRTSPPAPEVPTLLFCEWSGLCI